MSAITRQKLLSFALQGFWNDERGTVALTTGICAPVLVGFAALGIDVATWQTAQRSMQGTADMAAYSAAIAYSKSNGSSIVTQAKGVAAQMGYVDGQNGVTVTVNQPPTSGNYTSNTTAIEVIISQPQTRYFAGMFLSSNPAVKSRAVATVSSSGGSACILALNSSANQAINVSGSGSIHSPGCDVVSNSTSNSAINMSGSATIDTACLVAVGNVNTTSGLTEHNCTSPKIHATATADPYASVPAPTSSGACTTFPGGSSVSPGHYCSITVNGTTTFAAGTYIVDGNFSIQGSAHASGTGVTFYLKGTNTAISGSATATFTAPTSGTYSGILFFGDRSVTNGNNALSGGTTSNLNGALYFPTQSITFSGGSSSGSSCTQIIADKITVSGSSYLNGGCTTKISVADGTSSGSTKLVE